MVFSFSVLQSPFYKLIVFCLLETSTSTTTATSGQALDDNSTVTFVINYTGLLSTTPPVETSSPRSSTTTLVDSEKSPESTTTSIITTKTMASVNSIPTSTSHPPSTSSVLHTTRTEPVIIWLSDNGTYSSSSTVPTAKSQVPFILSMVFGGLALAVLIATALTFILVKKGYIRAFDRPRIRVKDVERTRIFGSTSTDGVNSPSRK